MRALVLAAFAAGVLIACTVWSQNRTSQATAPPERLDPTSALEAEQTPHPTAVEGGCQTGCSTNNHPIEPLTREKYVDLVSQFANETGEAREHAMETLLFHANRAREFMNEPGARWPDGSDGAFLRREISKTHVRLWLRLVDDNGIVRAEINGARFPIGEKAHLRMTTPKHLSPPEVSGTIHRTGLNHLWTRM